MRNLLALLAAVILVFLGLGWFRGWYKISSEPGQEGHRQIKIDVNTPKIQEDVNTGKTKLRDALSNDKDQTSTQRPTLGTPTGLHPTEDGGFIYPGETPTPPAGPPRLPVPQ